MSPAEGSDPTVVVVGPVMQDVLARPARPLATGTDTPATVVTTPGGAGANVAAWLAVTGTPATLLCRLGEDIPGDAVAESLTYLGVHVRARRDPWVRTGACVVLVGPDGERSMLPDAGANAALAPDDLPADVFAAGRHLHLSGYVLLDPGSRGAGLHALALAREAGMTTSVDPASAAPLADTGPDTFLDMVDGVDLLLPNADEARVLSGQSETDQAAQALGPRFGAVVCTLGSCGALWYAAGSPAVRVTAHEARVVDTTGAGDAFTAGFLSAWLRTREPHHALTAGCGLAAQAVRTLGAQPHRAAP